jgi:phosphoribosylamine--glycine ligase
MKRILLIGGGAREHAMARALKESGEEIELQVFASNRNPGLLRLAQVYQTGAMNSLPAMLEFASGQKPDFAVIGPEGPLALGLVDALQEIGIPSVGPRQSLARLESSKTFTRELLREYSIPGSPLYHSFQRREGLEEFLQQLPDGFVIKPDGLTGGKGVKVMGDHFFSLEEGLVIIDEVLEEESQVLIEEKLIGQEFSLMSFCDGEHFLHMPAVQDHKRAFEGDTGPNTGGMGTYSMAGGSLPFLQDADIEAARKINEAVGKALKQKCGAPYKGVLYGGFMATRDGIRLIEYNARLGDPEAMNVLSLFPERKPGDASASFLQVCEAIISGELNRLKTEWRPLSTVCKYAVPDGYPDAPLKGELIEVPEEESPSVRVFYASVEEKEGQLLLAGSRAVAVLAMHEELSVAEKLAEEHIRKIRGPVFHRSDIGTEALIQKRVEIMQQIRDKDSDTR